MTKLNFIIDAQYKAGNVFGRAKGDVDSLDESARKSSGSGGGMSSLTKILGRGMVVAAGAAVSAVGGLATAIVTSTQKAASLEAQMDGIAAVLGKTKDEVAPLQDLILKLGIDPKLKVNATEAAGAIEMLARNGLSMSEIMDGAARNTVLLANATNADFGTAADIATDAMSIFNIEAKDMGKAVDGITSVVNNSKLSIEDYRLALAQGGGMAATVGVGFEDFNTTLAAIPSLFSGGSDAGTSLKTMLQRLVPQSEKARKAMQKLGLVTEDGSNKFFDSEGNMKSMAEVAGLLHNATADLSDIDLSESFGDIFGSDSARAAAALAKFSRKEFESLKATMANTSAEEAAATRVDNLKGSLEILSGIFETLQLQIGMKFIPIFRRMVDALSSFIERNAGAIVGGFGRIADMVGIFMDTIDSSTGSFKDRMIEWAKIAWQWLAETAIPKATAKMLEWGNAIFGFVRDNLQTWVTNLSAWGSAAWEWIVGASGKAEDKLSEWAGALYAYVSENLSSWVTALLPWAKEIWSWIPRGISFALTKMGEWASALYGFVRDNAGTWKAALEPWASPLWTWIVDGAAEVPAKLKDWAGKLYAYVRDNLPTWGVNVATWSKALWTWIADGTGKVSSKMADWAGKLYAYVLENLPTWRTNVAEWSSALWQWIADGSSKIEAEMRDWASKLYAYVRDNLPTWRTNVATWSAALWGWIADGAAEVPGEMADWAGKLYAYVRDNLPVWHTNVFAWSAELWQWIVDGAGEVQGKMADWAGKLYAYARDNLPTWKTNVATWSAELWQWIVDGAAEVRGKMADWAGKVYAYVRDNLPTWKEKLNEWAIAATDWIKNSETSGRMRASMSEWRDNILSWMNENAIQPDEAVDMFSAFVESWGDITARVITGIAGMIVDVVEWITGTGKDQVGEGVDSLYGSLFVEDDPLMDAARERLKLAFSEALTKIGEALRDGAKAIGTAILDGLIEGLIPEDGWLASAISGFKKFWQTVKDFFGVSSPSTLAMDLAWDIWQGFINGFNGRIEEVSNHVGAVMRDIWARITSVMSFDTWFAWGGDLMRGLKDGIFHQLENVKTTLGDAMTTLKDLIPDIFGIGSPSKVFKGFGINLMDGLSGGITSGLDGVLSALDLSMGAVAGATSNVVNNSRSTNTTFNVSIPTTGGQGGDMRTDIQAARLADGLMAVTG